MVLTETLTHHANHISAIRTYKEDLKITYNVNITISRKLCKGSMQEIKITGSLSNITIVKNKILNIVSQAKEDYSEYRKRKSSKPQPESKIIDYNNLRCPKIVINKKKSSNPFYLLGDLSDSDSSCESAELIESDDKLTEISYLDNEYNPNLSWGDQLDYDE